MGVNNFFEGSKQNRLNRLSLPGSLWPGSMLPNPGHAEGNRDGPAHRLAGKHLSLSRQGSSNVDRANLGTHVARPSPTPLSWSQPSGSKPLNLSAVDMETRSPKSTSSKWKAKATWLKMATSQTNRTFLFFWIR